MKRLSLLIIFIVAIVSGVIQVLAQDATPSLEITGVNATDLSQVTIPVIVADSLGQPIPGLTIENFMLRGDLGAAGEIVSVESVRDDDLTLGIVLVIDTSSSMAGDPVREAQAAAQLFVENIGPNDNVAIVAFGNEVRLVQDFTADKAQLTDAINSLRFGGRTALYEASLRGVQLAAGSGNRRRAMILLSDGAEFGGISHAVREDALNEALIRGVPVYTIGLGFGTDRTYLQQLSNGTNARNFESPTPEELSMIYGDLARLLRSQYVVTVRANVPNDGTEYNIALEANTTEGAVSDNAILRAPIPVPLVQLTTVPDNRLDVSTDVTAIIAADDALSSVVFALDGAPIASLDAAPYVVTLDPIIITPGTRTLSVTVTDVDGDVAGASFSFESIEIIPDIILGVDLGTIGALSTQQSVAVEVSDPFTAASVAYSIDGAPGIALTDSPFAIPLDPATLSPGEHVLTVRVTLDDGRAFDSEQIFTVEALPPDVRVFGIEDGAVVDAALEVRVDILQSQTTPESLVFTVNGAVIDNSDRAPGSLLLDPAAIQPGPATLAIQLTEASGQVTTFGLNFTIAALPPVIVIGDLPDGAVLEENRTVQVEVGGQTAVTDVTIAIDDETISAQPDAPISVEIDIDDLGPGTHTLSVTAANAGGDDGPQTAAQTRTFTISQDRFLTQTAAVPTNTPTATPTLSSELITATAFDEEVQGLAADAGIGESEARATIEQQSTQVIIDREMTQRAEQTAQALLTQESLSETQAALGTQMAVDETATSETQTQAALGTQMAVDETATAEADAAGTSDAIILSATAAFDLTAVRNEAETSTAAALPSATATSNLAATRSANLTATQQVFETEVAQIDATTEQMMVNQAASETAFAGFSPTPSETDTPPPTETDTPTPTETVMPTEEDTAQPEETQADVVALTEDAATLVAQAVVTDTTEAQVSDETVEPSEESSVEAPADTPAGPTPTLIPLDVTGDPESSNILPIAIIIAIIGVLVLLILSRARGRNR